VLTKVIPVTLWSGRFRLDASPYFTGSPPTATTTGMVEFNVLTASAAPVEPLATITATRRWTKSAASAGKRSYRPSAQRNSIFTLFPSVYPAPARLRRNVAAIRGFSEPQSRKPTTGRAGSCARATSGHAAAPPMPRDKLPPSHPSFPKKGYDSTKAVRLSAFRRRTECSVSTLFLIAT
jgi:hypothetical protein